MVHLAFILATRDTDFADVTTRLAMASVGVWWFGFALWTLRVVPEPPVQRSEERLTPLSAIAIGFRELRRTFGEITKFRVTVVFLVAYLLFNDGISTVTAIAGAYAADTLAIPLVFNMGTVATIQFVAVPGALAFARLADRISTKPALIVALVGWVGIVLVGVSLAPLPPADHGDFDIQLEYREASQDYVVDVAPDLDGGYELRGRDQYWRIEEGFAFRSSAVEGLAEAFRDTPDVEHAVSIRGGPLDGESGVGEAHPSMLHDGPVDWWPSLVRDLVWAAARDGRGAAVADAGRDGGMGDRREPGTGAQPVRADHAGATQWRVLRVLRVHRSRVVRVRSDALHRGDGAVRHAGGGDVDPAHHRRRDHRVAVGRRRRRRTRRRRGGRTGRSSLTPQSGAGSAIISAPWASSTTASICPAASPSSPGAVATSDAASCSASPTPGATVVIAEIDEDSGPAMEQELRDAGHEALFIHTNVRDADSVEALVAGTVEQFGRLDVMVANAGGMFQAPALDISKRGFEAVIDLNLIGTWLCNTAAARAMIDGGRGGSIVNMSSQNALYGALNGPHYGAAKAGILGLTHSVAAEWAEHGIRVNALAPGGRTARAGAAPREGQLAGGGDAEYIENVAAAAVYLASDLASWITGHTLVVDDGGTFTNAAPRGA